MASLIEDFIETLDKEESEYRQLLEISKRKTPVIIKGDIEALSQITDEEQIVVDRISHLDKHRQDVLGDIATVLNKDVQTLKVPYVIDLLAGQEKEQKQLKAVYDKLKVTLQEMQQVNDQNRNLIQLSLDMVQFDMNLVQAMKQGPETGDYTKSGGYSDSGMNGSASRFDAKQ